MTPRILAVCVGLPRAIGEDGAPPVRSGIDKHPVSGPVAVGQMGLEGDGQADLVNHGGVDKAVYAYDRSDAGYWEKHLGRALPPGALGENLTVEGMASSVVRVGDRIRAGSVLLEVTQPRVPCYKLGVHMGDPAFPAAFAKALRVGFYLRVIEPGSISAETAISSWEKATTSLSISDLMSLYLTGRHDTRQLAAVAALPGLSAAWRKTLSEFLAAADR